MLVRRALHILSLLAALTLAALLGPHARAYAATTGMESLPYRMAALYALGFAAAIAVSCAVFASLWRLCRRPYQRVLLWCILALVVYGSLSEIGDHIARGDGISQIIPPSVGGALFTALLTIVTAALLIPLSTYVHSGWKKRIAGLRLYRTRMRVVIALMFLIAALAMWIGPTQLHLFGTRALLVYGWAALSLCITLLLLWPEQLIVDLLLLAPLAWPAYEWQLQPDEAKVLSSANAARFHPLSDVAEVLPLHRDSSKPRYQLLNFDCSRASASTCGPSTGATKHLILISVDALRKDALTWRDAQGLPLTPNLKNFATQSIWYERATTNYPATLLALGGVVSGLSPIELTLAEKPPSFVRDAKNENIKTHAIFPSSGWFSKKSFGRLVLDHFENVARHKTSAKAVEAALGVMRDTKPNQRLLLWLHLYDPHAPYRHRAELGFESSIRGKYRGEVVTTDKALGPLFDELQKARWSKNSTIIFFADHGESIDDYVGHHVYLNRAIADIPMLVQAPNAQQAQSQKVVTMQDIALTARHALGLKTICGSDNAYDLRAPELIPGERSVVADAFSMRGSTLFRFLNTPVRTQKAIEARLETLNQPADYEPKTAVISMNHRAVFHHRSGRFELFDRRAKNEEPLAIGSVGSTRDRMKTRLQHWMQTAPLRAACLWR